MFRDVQRERETETETERETWRGLLKKGKAGEVDENNLNWRDAEKNKNIKEKRMFERFNLCNLKIPSLIKATAGSRLQFQC